MSWLDDLSIRRKLIAVIAMGSAIVLLLANGALFVLDSLAYRNDLRERLEAIAEIAGRNSTAALEFNDPATAAELLASLETERDIRWAAIYDSGHGLFAHYTRDPALEPPPAPPSDAVAFSRDGVAIARPIVLHGRRVGTIAVLGGFDGLYARLLRRAFTVGIVLVAALLTALLVAQRLERVISEPILRLARVARAVSAERNYSLRAAAGGKDEVGQLVGSFNEMLAQIERRDAELLAAKETLEQRVAERTAQLQTELRERQRAEQELARRNEELEQTNRELDDFAYIASHDLKEPLRGIHNYSQFLLEDYANRLDEEGREKLGTLVRLSRRMEALIDSLLHYSRLGRGDLALTDVDVNELLAEVLELHAVTLREKDIDVRVPRPLPTVRADRDRLGEVLANLITNAVKYNDKSERWIEIGTVEPAEDDSVTFYVRDNGIGIQERHLDAVFRIFKRLHSRDEFGGGTGAGLTIVRKIVDRHQGRVWIESSPGVGTTVFFSLPCGTAEAGPQAPMKSPSR
ncbi:MAG TPA: ATP-binding protein [Vicinamibacterales bacterium]|nr:ATP-binding protein [Vicinamibacterales bacterium]